MKEKEKVRLIRPNYYTKDEIVNSKNHLFVTRSSHSPSDKIHDFKNYHKHELLGIEYLSSGTYTQFINGQQYECCGGTVTVISPIDVHRFKFNEKITTNGFFLYFTDSLIMPELQKYINYDKLPVITTIEDANLKQHMDSLFERLLYIDSQKRSEYSQIMSKILVNEILTTAVIHGTESENVPRQPSRMSEITNYIRDNFSEQLTTYHIADHFHMNRDYFLKYFKKYMNQTFTDYLTGIRMDYAKRLLLTSEMSMSDIASACGIQSPSYFSKLFKEYTGVKPSEFRLPANSLDKK